MGCLRHPQPAPALLGAGERGNLHSKIVDILIAPNVEVVPGQVHTAVLLDGLAVVIVGIADNDTTLCFLCQVPGGVSDDPRLLPFAFQEAFT